MSEENVEVVRRGFESFQQGGPEAFLELFSDDAVTYRHQPDGATFHGKAGFRDAAADWTEDFSEWQGFSQEVIDLGRAGLGWGFPIAQGGNSGGRVEGG